MGCVIGFAKLDHLYIFKDKSISFDNSIVLAMEMEAGAIATAPSDAANYEVQKIYKDLGEAGNKIAGWLREKGFACHAVPPRNGLTPRTLTSILVRSARDSSALDPLVGTLPVAGFSGTLTDRYREDPAASGAGWVRAKTGRLPTAAALTGLVETRDGRLLAFAFMAGEVPSDPLAASEQLDRAAAGLARCACGG